MGAKKVVRVKRSDGVGWSGVKLENRRGEMDTLVMKFKEENELGKGTARGERRDIELWWKRGNEVWTKFRGKFQSEELNRLQ